MSDSEKYTIFVFDILLIYNLNMEEYKDLITKFMAAEKGSEEYLSLFYKLQELDTSIPTRIRNCAIGNYYLPLPKKRKLSNFIVQNPIYKFFANSTLFKLIKYLYFNKEIDTYDSSMKEGFYKMRRDFTHHLSGMILSLTALIVSIFVLLVTISK
jgi:hypothetical protein